ncbi:hypothetical protein K525DRAFT_273227 [Schizophyllum commune Loenen D]|nr:hypothetical protein K525DRAFT_273227 [Schizophyllum commune Loenen D]
MATCYVAERTQTAMQDLEGCFAFIDTVDRALRFARDVKYNTMVADMQLSGCTRDPRLLIAFKETAGHTRGFIQKAAIAMDALAAFILATHCSAYCTDPPPGRARGPPSPQRTRSGSRAGLDKLLHRRLSGLPLVRAVSKRTVTPVVRLCKRVLPSRPRHRTKLSKLRDTLDEMQWSVFATGKLMSYLQDEVPDLMNPKGGFIEHLAYKINTGNWVYLVELMDLLQENYPDVKGTPDSLKRMAAEIEQVA